MNREEALLWLNDRCGRRMEVSIILAGDEFTSIVMEAIGKLGHWSQEMGADIDDAKRLGPRDDLAGWYTVGNCARFDVTNIGDALIDGSESELRVELDNAVSLELREHAES